MFKKSVVTLAVAMLCSTTFAAQGKPGFRTRVRAPHTEAGGGSGQSSGLTPGVAKIAALMNGNSSAASSAVEKVKDTDIDNLFLRFGDAAEKAEKPTADRIISAVGNSGKMFRTDNDASNNAQFSELLELDIKAVGGTGKAFNKAAADGLAMVTEKAVAYCEANMGKSVDECVQHGMQTGSAIGTKVEKPAETTVRFKKALVDNCGLL